MSARAEVAGKTFGRLTVLRDAEPRNGQRWITCRCACGTIKDFRFQNVRRGSVTSCGCYHREQLGDRRRTHARTKTPEWYAWCAMKQRCYNSSRKEYSHYGGRGIIVCVRWRDSFENFFADVGPRPSPRYSIDRIDNDGDYEPGNCRWATWTQQLRNTGRIRRVTINGETRSVPDWLEHFGMTSQLFAARTRKQGWSDERALMTPVKR